MFYNWMQHKPDNHEIAVSRPHEDAIKLEYFLPHQSAANSTKTCAGRSGDIRISGAVFARSVLSGQNGFRQHGGVDTRSKQKPSYDEFDERLCAGMADALIDYTFARVSCVGMFSFIVLHIHFLICLSFY